MSNFNPSPLSPLSPFAPWSPVLPLIPWAPVSPFSPCTPCCPCGPVTPCSPWMPWSPFKSNQSLVCPGSPCVQVPDSEHVSCHVKSFHLTWSPSVYVCALVHNPFHMVSPLSPFVPWAPVTPCSPWSPWGPCTPCIPFCEVSGFQRKSPVSFVYLVYFV